MLGWLLGSSTGKEEKKQKPAEKKENLLSNDELWVYDYIRQYLTSPIWRNPILDFVEENCTIFQDSEENKFEYTKIFQEFQSIASILIQSMLDETGITDKQLQKCIIKGLRGDKDRKIFQQVLLCDNFLSFKRIMTAKNKQLELEALKKIQVQTQANKNAVALSQLELERMQIQKAIAISMAMQEKMRQQQQKELQEAIKQSTLSAQQELKKSHKQQEKKSTFQPLPPLVIGTSRINKPIQQYKKQQEQISKEISNLKKVQLTQQQKESADERKKRLLQQRQLIRKKKQQQRQEQLQSFVLNKPTNEIGSKVVDEKQMERRRNLMKKLKEQLKD